jgi:hypothetical protein
MPIPYLATKIRPDHLARHAWIYVRQSTLAQVRDNVGSTARQYDLERRCGFNLSLARDQHECGVDPEARNVGTHFSCRDCRVF